MVSITDKTNLSLLAAASIAMLFPSGENSTSEICELLKKDSTGIGVTCAVVMFGHNAVTTAQIGIAKKDENLSAK
ncbi:hypothetical protein ACO0K7_15140 [Undibacterium sp. Ji67W]|uniref:hypothetical protein n=1 Tax=Undibacterium sp. Ji67W TaxID=3413042 RepID=UPI003BF450FD